MTRLPRSALARPLDFAYPSNRVAALGALAGVAVARMRGRSWPDAVAVGGAAFLAWATARELDPDHPGTANAALPVAALAALGARGSGPAALLAGGAALSGLRVVAGTTGESPTRLDHAALFAQALAAAASGGTVGALVCGAAPLLTAGPRSAVPAMGALLPPLTARRGSARTATAAAVAALAVARHVTAPEPVSSVCDRAGRAVRSEDVRRARVVAVLALAAGVLGGQTAGLLPVAAAVGTLGGRRLAASLKVP